MDKYGTHQKVLFKAVSFTQKNVIEFGAGDFSTEQLHELCRDRLLVTVEDNGEWLGKYIHLRDDHHLLVDSLIDDDYWGVVFIDNGTWEARLEMIDKYMMKTDYMVVHDTEAMFDWSIVGPAAAAKFKNITDWGVYFKWFAEFRDISGGPCTIIGSNFIDITNLEIDGMQRIYRNNS